MINLTRLNGHSFTLNLFLIEQIEALPDTTITLTNGKKIVVNETVEQVTEKAVGFMKQLPLISAVCAKESGEACLKVKA
ncbi:flagellar protein FlbD [Scopulibacillus darangshiensis]|uniref:Flagellar protein FlbD n=1 Tax=Scopulibacillus darangshiensis TaxID=442528 RepID=A0A4R2P668_9BACL|nr:flagellar FlbD family protein [Scopulibacillus darangshiensis]TCP30323.1 flagellar protein FlbD [Scopulibacillus darangshiensis]